MGASFSHMLLSCALHEMTELVGKFRWPVLALLFSQSTSLESLLSFPVPISQSLPTQLTYHILRDVVRLKCFIQQVPGIQGIFTPCRPSQNYTNQGQQGSVSLVKLHKSFMRANYAFCIYIFASKQDHLEDFDQSTLQQESEKFWIQVTLILLLNREALAGFLYCSTV